MDEVMTIRHRVLVQGVSRRKVAREMGVSRNTVDRYVDGAAVGERKPVGRGRPALERARSRMDALLGDAPKWTGGKQRLTATQLWRLLKGEGIHVGVTLVKQYVAEWKRARAEVFVPLTYKPGDLAEVDFFEVLVTLGGKRVKAFMFLMRLMFSGRDFAWLFPRQDGTAFLEGHARAFAHFGAVPQRVLYDNLRPAVAKVLVGSERTLTTRFTALANHFLFEPCFARPATGHDKGGVEARGKGIRWQHLVPIPEGASLVEMSEALLRRLDADAAERKDPQGRTVAGKFTDDELPRMLALSGAPFDPAQVVFASASRSAMVKVHGGHYSVPTRWARLQLTVRVGVDRVCIVGPGGIAEHARVPFGGKSVDYRHYLPELARKPQAVRQVIDELLPRLDDAFARAWRELVDAHGAKQAARHFAQILGRVVEQGEDEIARKLRHAMAEGAPVSLALRPAPRATASLTREALPEALQAVEVATSPLEDFDALLGGAR